MQATLWTWSGQGDDVETTARCIGGMGDVAGDGAGNFVDLVDRGFYTKMAIQRSDGFVIQVRIPRPSRD